MFEKCLEMWKLWMWWEFVFGNMVDVVMKWFDDVVIWLIVVVNVEWFVGEVVIVESVGIFIEIGCESAVFLMLVSLMSMVFALMKNGCGGSFVTFELLTVFVSIVDELGDENVKELLQSTRSWFCCGIWSSELSQ